MLYSCKEKKATNEKQLALVKKDCQNKEACQIEVTRDFFGNSECPGTDDADMNLWLIYSCNDGGSDKTTSHKPKCKSGTGTGTDACASNDVEQGEMTQVDIPGCGGWVNIDCNGGCINIIKVLKGMVSPFETCLSFGRIKTLNK